MLVLHVSFLVQTFNGRTNEGQNKNKNKNKNTELVKILHPFVLEVWSFLWVLITSANSGESDFLSVRSRFSLQKDSNETIPCFSVDFIKQMGQQDVSGSEGNTKCQNRRSKINSIDIKTDIRSELRMMSVLS